MGKSLVEKVCIYNKALCEPQRVKMMKIICSAEKNSVCVTDIAQLLGISQPAATKHLKILCAAGFITRKRMGTSVYYSVNTETVQDYQKVLELSFIQGYKACYYGFDCDNCPHKETCA